MKRGSCADFLSEKCDLSSFRSVRGRRFSKTMVDLKLNDKEGQSVEVTVNDFCCLIFQNKVPEGKSGGFFCLNFGFFKSLIFVRKTD